MKHLLLIPALLLLLPLHAEAPSPEAREARRLARFDTDKDGTLSPEERQAAARTLREEHKKSLESRKNQSAEKKELVDSKREIALLQRFDTNRDGSLSPQERAQAESILQQERQGNRQHSRR